MSNRAYINQRATQQLQALTAPGCDGFFLLLWQTGGDNAAAVGPCDFLASRLFAAAALHNLAQVATAIGEHDIAADARDALAILGANPEITGGGLTPEATQH